MTSSKTFAQARTSSSEIIRGDTPEVTIPEEDWILCQRYKSTLETRTKKLKTCGEQGIEVRRKRDQCVGELSGKTSGLKECSEVSSSYRLELELLKEGNRTRRSASFWISVGAGIVSTGVIALELFGGDSPEVSKLVATGSALAFSIALFAWTF
jgi:hypothetical protein